MLGALIDRVGTDSGASDRRAQRPTDHYGVLVRAIVGQQLSTRAAAAIFQRLTARFGGRVPTPDEILAEDPDDLRTAVGLSHAKVVYLRSLAEHVVDGSLALNALAELGDEEVTARLIAVKGIGPWTADMFLMLHLRRPDVVASGDLGIRRAVMLAYSLEATPSAREVQALADAWRPHRTLACEILWQSLDATPV